MKKLLFVLLLLGALISLAGNVTAVECGTTPSNGCTVSSSTTFNNGYLNLRGVDGFLNSTDDNLTSPNTTGQITVSFWVNFSSSTFKGISQGYVNFVNKNAYGPLNAEWAFRRYNSTALDGVNRTCRTSFYVFNITGGTGIGSYFQDNDTAFNCDSQLNIWIHVVGVINGSNTIIYKNGVQRDTDAYIGQIFPVNGNASLKVGTDFDSANAYLNGSIDELRIYNRSLTLAEIVAINNSGRIANASLNSTGLVHWNSFDDGGGLSALDKVYGNNGTLIGGISFINESPVSYNLNGISTSSGAVNINANNIVLNCNNAELLGNWSTSGNNAYIGVYINTKNNVTLQNCKIRNYNYGIRQRLSNNTYVLNSNFTLNRMGIYLSLNDQNSTYANTYFMNNSYAGIWIQSFNGTGMNVTNNTFFNNADGIREETTNSNFMNLIAYNNVFYQNFTSANIRGAITQQGGAYWTLTNNIVYGSYAAFSYGIDMRGMNNTFTFNTIKGTQYGLAFTDSINNTLRFNNISENDDPAILRSSYIYIYNNIFKNNTNNVDGYNLGLSVQNSSYIFVENNSFTEIATIGILLQGSSNITIRNNTFNFLSIAERANYLSNDGNEPRCLFLISKSYKGFFGSINYGNDNITLSNNAYDTDTPCLMHLENATNLVHDFTGYWYFKFHSPVEQIPNAPQEFFIPNNFDNLTRYSPIQGIRNQFYNNLGGSTLYTAYNISRSRYVHTNLNLTSQMNITLYNLTNAFIVWNNGTIFKCNGLNVCSDQVNITLFSGNSTFVYDNFVNNTLSLGLVARYSFNENRGNTSYDKSIYRNNGTLMNGTNYVTDQIIITIPSTSYNLTGTNFVLTNDTYSWQLLNISYNYGSGSSGDSTLANLIYLIATVLGIGILAYLSISIINNLRDSRMEPEYEQ